jgi:hypothetical protein
VPSSPFNLPEDQSHPVSYALSRACDENWGAFSDTVAKVAVEAARPIEERISEADVAREIEIALSYIENVAEILTWIVYRKALPMEEAFQRAQRLRELGEDWVQNMFSRLQKLPQGRPAARRQSHVAAFEFMLLSKKNSQGQAVKKFCPCGKTHQWKCQQNLKAGVHSLTKMLRKYAPELVAQYDALHPDRAKKPRQGRAS